MPSGYERLFEAAAAAATTTTTVDLNPIKVRFIAREAVHRDHAPSLRLRETLQRISLFCTLKVWALSSTFCDVREQ